MFRKVLVASAAIPVLFPPTFIDVEAGGKVYDEMHVDGGTVGQMFFFGFAIDWRSVLQKISSDQIQSITAFSTPLSLVISIVNMMP